MINLESLNTDIEATTASNEEEEDSLNESSSPTWALGDILQSLEEPDRSPLFLVSKTNELVSLLQKHPYLKKELVLSVFGRRVQKLLSHPAKEVVATGYRTARYAIFDIQSLRAIIGLHTDSFVLKSLAKDAKFNVEREQAIKFIRGYLEIPDGANELSLGVVCALVAVAEDSTDKLSNIAVETLAELLLYVPEKINAAGGVKVLALTLANGPYDLAEGIAVAFMQLLDKPGTRKYIWAGQDLDVIFSPLTELQEQDHMDEAKVRSCSRVIAMMLKSWPGLFYMCMFDFRSIKAFVEILRLPIAGLRDVIMDLYFEILNIKTPAWSAAFLAGQKMTDYAGTSSDEQPGLREVRDKSRSLTDKYVALLLALFIETDLLKVLFTVIEENTDAKNTRKAMLLLGEIISLSAKILPQQYAIKTQILGGLFRSAARLETIDRFAASSAIFQIDRITKNLYHSFPDLALQNQRDGGLPVKESRRSELKKLRLGLHLDDTYFRSLLLETNVLSTKNYSKWNWDTLIEIMQGPLMNPKRLDEAIRATKFMKRLMSFYRPFKYRFSEVRKTSTTQRYVKAGCVLVKTLLANPEGVKYLSENKLLRQIAECMAQLDPMSGITSSEPLFSKQRLETTLSYGYFTLLGTLSSDPNGVMMIERWRMFNMFYHLSELTSRKDLIVALISSLDYHLEGHPRILLGKVLTTGEKEVRMFATSFVGTLLDLEDLEMHDWAVQLLVEQLYDVDQEVCDLAVKTLGDACMASRTLDRIVECLPDLEYLTESVSPLLLRFLSTPQGLEYLKGLDYVEQQMQEWYISGNETYVYVVERQLAISLLAQNSHAAVGDSTLPPHFYRELVRTAEGCKILKQKDHVRRLCEYIELHHDEEADPVILTKLKSCLWAIGNIASMELGVPFVEEAEITKTIFQIATTSQVWSLKGTAFYVISLISSTPRGLEMVDEYGWESTVSVMGDPMGLCVPKDIRSFLELPPWESFVSLRPSRRGVYVADADMGNLKQVVVAAPQPAKAQAQKSER
ncbi:Rapamycin-insensitive companion of mTOR, N-term-domain-containing protein [Myxozyma melibiosi]|uniref:Rapamycin-insensitive companion of mTOR, N-term-domain-containing protein n=1 Tax=Myxozyma melibiosi TaxID=54550 RepID=A0ABR1F2A8_9ASCO